MKIVFINRFFHPDVSATSQMLSDVAFKLAERGHAVTVLTSRSVYEGGGSLQGYEHHRGVEIVRLPGFKFGRANMVGRALDYLSFGVFLVFSLLRRVARGDVVVAKTDPPLLSLVAYPLVRLKRARLLNWLQDIFPEVLEKLDENRSGPFNAGLKVLRRLRDATLRGADGTIVIGSKMAAVVERSGVPRERVHIVRNWADGQAIRPIDRADNDLRRAWGLEDAFVVGYSGNLGRAHDIDTMLGAIDRQQNSPQQISTLATPRIVWLFIGSGYAMKRLQQACTERGYRNTLFKPYQAREHLASSLCAVDVHLVSLRPALEGYIVPSKYYGIAAAGRAAIFIGDAEGEIAGELARNATGVTIKEGDSAHLASTIEHLAGNPDVARQMGTRARAAFEREYDVTLAVDAWERIIAPWSKPLGGH
jgi:colanic acid biosynthesis glycosyl transferase WcaI